MFHFFLHSVVFIDSEKIGSNHQNNRKTDVPFDGIQIGDNGLKPGQPADKSDTGADYDDVLFSLATL